MLLYNGSKFVKGNVFVDPIGAKLTFDKNTKKCKLFVMENGSKVGLTEGQVSKLKLLNEYNIVKKIDTPNVIGINIKFDGFDEDFTILEKSLKNFNVYTQRENQNHTIGYVCFDMKKVKLGNLTLNFLKDYQKSGTLEVMLDDLTSEVYNVQWFQGIQKIQDDIYICLFEGTKEQS